MFHKFRCLFSFCKRRIYLLFLAVSAVSGLRSGIYFAAKSELLPSLMRIAVGCNVSIVGLIIVAYVPFLCCVCAISASQPWLIYLICFFRLFLHGGCATGIDLAFGSAGWLIQLLLQFTDTMTLPLFLCLAARSLGRRSIVKTEWRIYLFATGVIVTVDICLISPFLVDLIRTYETTGRYAVSCWI